MSLSKTPIYQSYRALSSRPLGVEPWDQDENGDTIIALGEVFCRYNISDDDEILLCTYTKPFSNPANLRTHAVSHACTFPPMRKGTASNSEVAAAVVYYRKVMNRHTAMSTGDTGETNEASTESSITAVTPARPPPITPNLPPIPRKRDGSINQSAVKKAWVNAGHRGKCEHCRDAKQSCPLLPRGASNDCELWGLFAQEDWSEEEDEAEDEDETGSEE